MFSMSSKNRRPSTSASNRWNVNGHVRVEELERVLEKVDSGESLARVFCAYPCERFNRHSDPGYDESPSNGDNVKPSGKTFAEVWVDQIRLQVQDEHAKKSAEYDCMPVAQALGQVSAHEEHKSTTSDGSLLLLSEVAHPFPTTCRV